ITPGTIILEEGRPILEDVSPPATDAMATDLFAVATVLYESVSGRPWTAPAGTDPARVDWSGVPPRLRRALLRALSPVPERRWRDAAALCCGSCSDVATCLTSRAG